MIHGGEPTHLIRVPDVEDLPRREERRVAERECRADREHEDGRPRQHGRLGAFESVFVDDIRDRYFEHRDCRRECRKCDEHVEQRREDRPEWHRGVKELG